MSLTGKRAVVGGMSGAYADVVAARLRAEGARVTGGTGNVPDLAMGSDVRAGVRQWSLVLVPAVAAVTVAVAAWVTR